MPCEKATALLPLPSEVPPVAGTRVPKLLVHAPGLVCDQRKKPSLAAPRGIALPFNVAELLVTTVAAMDVVDGASAVVVKVTMPPNAVPDAFEAIAHT